LCGTGGREHISRVEIDCFWGRNSREAITGTSETVIYTFAAVPAVSA
jgi:hypothetical protein